MLSYRHSYHAGNFADVIKHIVIIEILGHLSGKSTPFDYIDTHSGAGLYNLTSEHASKLQEYTQGVAKLNSESWPELSRYFEIMNKYKTPGRPDFYPGSPLIAIHFLRTSDRAWLFEMHPADYDLLKNNTANDRRIKVFHDDGYKGLLSLLPPISRRGLILIDPSYEIKTDYTRVFDTLTKAYKKFSTGIYAIWYPVVERKRIDQLEQRLTSSGIKKIQRYELGLTGDSKAMGMTAAGMIVINPPWMLQEKMNLLLPRLVSTLGKDESAFFKSDVLVGE